MSVSDSHQPELPLYAPPAAVDEILVPARMVNEWVYCPRLAVLEWGHGEWAHNADTSAGRRSHRATEDGPAPALPAPEKLDEDLTLQTRRLLLASEKLGLTAEIDVLEAENGEVTPVDIKTGKRPHVAEGAYLPERVQVCVQGLLLRDAGYECREGALFFAASRERVRVAFDEELVATSLRAASELRLTVASGRLPHAARSFTEMSALLTFARLLAGRGQLVQVGGHPTYAPATGFARFAALCAKAGRPHRQEGFHSRRTERG